MIGTAALRTAPAVPSASSQRKQVVQPRRLETRIHAEAPGSSSTGKSADETSAPSLGRRGILATGAALLPGLVGCPVCAAQWGYSYLDGPPTWGGMCMNGGVQSPIDIRSDILKYARKEDRPRMITNYRKTNVKVIDTGHGTMQVNFPEGSNTLDIGDNKYDLVQFHFHTPSEHAFNGVRDDMEVHLVHRRRGGSDLAVLGVMLSAKKQSRENKALGMALDYAPQYSFEEETIKNMDPNILLPPGGVEKTGIIRYQGSLTTPPCSEQVTWMVCTKKNDISSDQVIRFQRYVARQLGLGTNSRPLQAVTTSHDLRLWR